MQAISSIFRVLRTVTNVTQVGLIFVIAFLSAVDNLAAQPPRDLGAQWQQLFNGKDLSGWKEIGRERWVVEDGAIYGEGVTKEYGYLATVKKYKDPRCARRCFRFEHSSAGCHTSRSRRERRLDRRGQLRQTVLHLYQCPQGQNTEPPCKFFENPVLTHGNSLNFCRR